jgi:MFS family permease
MTTYTGAQRTKGLALWGAVGSLGVAAGVLFGGALTTWAGWQLIFWVNVPIGVVALALGVKVLPKDATARADLAQFDLPGALTVIGGLAALMYGLASTSPHGWLSVRALVAFAVSAVLLASFVRVETRAARPLVPSHTWKVRTLVSGTTVMLGATALLVGTVFLASIFFQTVLGYSALRAGLAFLPLALAITAGTHLASKLLTRTSPRTIAAGGLALVTAGAALLSLVGSHARFATDLLPGLLVLGAGTGLVFVAVAVTAMAGIPAQHAGMASGFLMTGHEIGAALGVAVLSAVATAAGSLTDPARVVDGFTTAFLAAAVLAALVGVVAYLRMPATRMDAAAARHMHHWVSYTHAEPPRRHRGRGGPHCDSLPLGLCVGVGVRLGTSANSLGLARLVVDRRPAQVLPRRGLPRPLVRSRQMPSPARPGARARSPAARRSWRRGRAKPRPGRWRMLRRPTCRPSRVDSSGSTRELLSPSSRKPDDLADTLLRAGLETPGTAWKFKLQSPKVSGPMRTCADAEMSPRRTDKQRVGGSSPSAPTAPRPSTALPSATRAHSPLALQEEGPPDGAVVPLPGGAARMGRLPHRRPRAVPRLRSAVLQRGRGGHRADRRSVRLRLPGDWHRRDLTRH